MVFAESADNSSALAAPEPVRIIEEAAIREAIANGWIDAGRPHRSLYPRWRAAEAAEIAEHLAPMIERRGFTTYGAFDETGLRLAPARAIPSKRPEWLLAVATKQDAASVAA